MIHSYPITDAALRWLEVILAERFGQVWHLARSREGLRLQLANTEGADSIRYALRGLRPSALRSAIHELGCRPRGLVVGVERTPADAGSGRVAVAPN